MESSKSELNVSIAHSDQSEGKGDGGRKKGMNDFTPIQFDLIEYLNSSPSIFI